jgi:hypothetical protein
MIDAEIHFAPPAFAGAGGQYAASSRPRYSPIDLAIGSARDAQICSRLASPSSRDPVKYPGWPGATACVGAACRAGHSPQPRAALEPGSVPGCTCADAARRAVARSRAAQSRRLAVGRHPDLTCINQIGIGVPI